ncbi:MAG: DnaJ domain-containing protein [Candidatus Obscuribacterales bacterium]|nr:DnaJ domain-containing protein [Candidatus Obscuribacterales bacterium]
MNTDEERLKVKSQSTSQAPKDFYYILGVSPNASPGDIVDAYAALSDKFGPQAITSDLDPELQQRTWRDISTAYETLSDPNRRREYDKNSAVFRQTSDVRALWNKVTSGVQQVVQSTQQAQTQEIKNVQGKIQAQSLEMEIDVTLKEAIKGTHRQLTISDPKACEECINLKPVNRMQCTTCRGVGYFTVERVLEIDFPKGLFDGLEIRKTGQGKWDMRAGAYGDLILKIKLRQHPVLGVIDRDITINVPVTIYEAMLGAEIEIPTATGKVVMKIQPLTQPGRVYRLKGLGLAGGDQLVTIDVVIPQQLSAEEVKYYQKLKELYSEKNPREQLFQAISQSA